MRTQQRYRVYAMLVTLLLLLASCGVPGFASGSPSPAQILQNSVDAMSHVQSAHIDLQANVNMPSSPSSANTITNMSAVNVTGHSDVANPDKVSLDLLMGDAQLLSVVSIGQKVYLREKSGNWFFLEKNQIKDKEQSFFSQSLTQRMGQIMVLLQEAQLTDHGQESLNGETLEHITATLDGQTLQALSGQFNGFLSTSAVQGQNQLQKAVLDVWIDLSTSYVHQAQLDLMATAQMPSNGQQGQEQGPVKAQPVELKLQLNFSKFNAPVTIQAPANAVALP